VAVLPAGVGWRQVWGVSLLCGIGFTMSLFIASLGFAEAALLDAAKIGILAASLVSGLAGALVLIASGGPRTREYDT
jgi:NhaA family Na+:H+ antiporter